MKIATILLTPSTFPLLLINFPTKSIVENVKDIVWLSFMTQLLKLLAKNGYNFYVAFASPHTSRQMADSIPSSDLNLNISHKEGGLRMIMQS